MDKGTDAVPILLGRTLPLQNGWIGMVNRSQQDINSRKPITHALADEMTFFYNHPAYRSIADRCGTSFLAHRCSKVQPTNQFPPLFFDPPPLTLPI